MLKYVQQKETEVDDERYSWSIRHAVVYQKVDFATCESNTLLIRSSDAMNERLSYRLLRSPESSIEFVSDWTSVHALCISSMDDGFRDNINCLDHEISTIVSSKPSCPERLCGLIRLLTNAIEV